MYRAAVAMSHAGKNVVVEDVVWEASVAVLARQSFDAVGAFVVRLFCPVTVALARERARADRFVGSVAAYASEPELISDVDLSLGHLGPPPQCDRRSSPRSAPHLNGAADVRRSVTTHRDVRNRRFSVML